MSVNTGDVADHLERRKDEILARWRKAAEEESAESKRLADLDDNELLDHLPAMTEALICVLRGEKSSGIEGASRRHGHQRRLDGYSVLGKQSRSVTQQQRKPPVWKFSASDSSARCHMSFATKYSRSCLVCTA